MVAQARSDIRDVRFGTSCRGSGKVFIRLSCEVTGELSWEATSRTALGAEAPAKVVVSPTLGPVLEVAVIMCTQNVEVRCRDAAGALVAEGSCQVRPKTAKAVSILNGAVHAEEVALMRELVRVEQDEGVTFRADRLIHVWYPDAEPERLLHFTLTVRRSSRSSVSGPIELSILAIDGAAVDASNVVVLSDSVARYPDAPSAEERTLQVSARITPAQGSVCVWARFADGRPDAFFVVMPNEMRDLSITGDSEELPVEGAGNYEGWMLSERVDESALAAQRLESESFAIRPLFSVVIPLYHTPLDYLAEAVDSILEQSYPRIELILVNSTPDDVDLKARVDAYARSDGRVKVVELEENLGITENTNAGIAYATGDFVCFMDHDDLCERDLFFEYAKGINAYPTTDLLYCDEDLFVEGHYRNAFLKPDWSVTFEETNNYACHLLAVRRSIMGKVPRPTSDVDGAQDHSLTLAVSEHARNVYHARKVLYHWRSHPLSTAQNPEVKPESLEAGRLAIARHLERLGIDAEVRPYTDWLHVYEVRLSLPERPHARVLVWGDGKMSLKVCDALERVVDAEFVDVRRRGDEPWSAAVARAVADCDEGLMVLVSRSVRVTPETDLTQLVAYARRPDLGVCAPRLLHADGTIASLGIAVSGRAQILHMGTFLPKETGFGRGIARLAHLSLAADPALLVADAALVAEAGGWDGWLGMEEAAVDLCLRLRALGRPTCVVSPSEVCVPLRQAPSEHRITRREERRLQDFCELVRRWPQLTGPDPYYHGGLSSDGKFGFEGGWRWLIPMSVVENLRYKVSY